MKQIFLIMAVALLMTGCQTSTQYTVDGAYQGGASYSNPTENKKELAKIRTSLAAQYIQENKLDIAQVQLESAFKADPRYAPAYDMMGNLLRQEGSPQNVAKADEYFRRAIALDPDFMQAHNNYGVYLSEIGKYTEAINQLNIASSTLGYQGRAGALENLGLTYLKVNNKPYAEAAFNKALEVDQNSVVARIELIDLLIDQNKTLQAKNHYDNLKQLWQAQNEPMPARLLFSGIRLTILQNNPIERQRLSQQLLTQYPLSNEAKKLKVWLSNPNGALK